MGLDWDECIPAMPNCISSSMSWESLFEVLSEMVNELRDGHVNLKQFTGYIAIPGMVRCLSTEFQRQHPEQLPEKDYIITSD